MPTLTAAQLAAYATVYDFRTQFCAAARQILEAAGFTVYQPGQGVPELARTYTAIDFQRGAADPSRKLPVPLDYGGGPWRNSEYARFTGTLLVANYVPFEQDEQSGDFFITAEHARTLDQACARQHALFQEHLQPFTAALLPNLDVLALLPLEPDERPVDEREVNVAYMRWQLVFEVRRGAPGLPTGTAGV